MEKIKPKIKPKANDTAKQKQITIGKKINIYISPFKNIEGYWFPKIFCYILIYAHTCYTLKYDMALSTYYEHKFKQSHLLN